MSDILCVYDLWPKHIHTHKRMHTHKWMWGHMPTHTINKSTRGISWVCWFSKTKRWKPKHLELQINWTHGKTWPHKTKVITQCHHVPTLSAHQPLLKTSKWPTGHEEGWGELGNLDKTHLRRQRRTHELPHQPKNTVAGAGQNTTAIVHAQDPALVTWPVVRTDSLVFPACPDGAVGHHRILSQGDRELGPLRTHGFCNSSSTDKTWSYVRMHFSAFPRP